MKEIWKPVVGFKDKYEVSHLGRVRSLDRTGGYPHPKTGEEVKLRFKGKTLRPGLTSAGYLSVSLCGKTNLVHRVTARAFIGECPEGQEVRHRDGSRVNNRACNLSYGTRSQNNLDKRHHGTNRNGHKLTERERHRVRGLYGSTPLSQRDLARKFGVHVNTIYNIIYCLYA